MEESGVKIKKFNYVPNVGYHYMIADHFIVNENKSFINLHEFTVNHKSINELTYKYRWFNTRPLTSIFERDFTVDSLSNAFIQMRIEAINNELAKEEDERLKYFLPLTEIDSGIEVFYNLRFFKELEKMIGEFQWVALSDELKDILNKLKPIYILYEHNSN